jgi:hypothetical protein
MTSLLENIGFGTRSWNKPTRLRAKLSKNIKADIATRHFGCCDSFWYRAGFVTMTKTDNTIAVCHMRAQSKEKNESAIMETVQSEHVYAY